MVPKKSDFELARMAAKRGAAVVRERFGRTLKIEEKADQKGLVTDADKQAEAAIMECLLSSSSYGVLAEESGLSAGESGAMWVVDPLDGTNNFARGLPLFAVSIALVLDFKSLLGVIVNPLTGDEYCAIQGELTLVNGKAVNISDRQQRKTPSIFAEYGYATEDRQRFIDVAQRLVDKSDLRTLGTTALELGFVSAGQADAFVCSGDELWDFAAGLVIAEGAGCIVSDWRGQPWEGSNSYLLVSHPKWHAWLVNSIRDLQSSE
jgi:myo-inositol-1(or 4)-monophosphatase